MAQPRGLGKNSRCSLGISLSWMCQFSALLSCRLFRLVRACFLGQLLHWQTDLAGTSSLFQDALYLAAV